MTDRILQIRIRPIGQESVTRAVRGITQGARQQQRQLEQQARQTERARIAGERNATREAQRGAQARLRADQNAAREAQRAAAATARAREQATRQAAQAETRANRSAQQEANDLFRLRMRLHQRAQREHQRAQREQQQAQQQRVGREARIFGGAAAGGTAMATAAIMGGLEAITRRMESVATAVGSRAGVVDAGQRIADAQDFEIQLARMSGEFFQGQDASQRSASRAALTTEIQQTSLATGQSPTELLNALSTMQSQFSQFEVGRRDLRAIADEAQRTGADMNDLAMFIGTLNQQLGDTAPTAQRAFDIMAQAGLEGAITPASFSENFGGMLGQFQASSGLQGEEALRQFSALANIVRPGAQSDAEAATQVHGLIAALGSPRTRDHIREAMGGTRVGHGASALFVGGSTAFRDDGTVDYAQLIQDMSTIESTSQGSGVATALRQAGARDAMTSLTRAQRHEVASPDFATLTSVDAEAAAQWRSGNLADVQGTTAFQARQIAMQGEINGLEELTPAAGGAMDLLAFREAGTQTHSDFLTGMIDTITPDIVSQRIVPSLAGMIAGMSDQHRAAAMGTFGQLAHAGSAAPLVGAGLAGMFGMAGQAFGQLGGIGDRQQALAEARRVALEPGSVVRLDPQSTAEIGRAVASSMPASTPGGTPPSSLRVPLSER